LPFPAGSAHKNEEANGTFAAGHVEDVGRRCVRFRGTFVGALLLFVAAATGAAAFAATSGDAVDPHAHHHLDAAANGTRSVVHYEVPAVRLVRDDGKSVELRDELDDGRPVVLAFIYTSCTTVCPLTSHTLAQLQSRLGAARDQVHLVSITIDPEQDTPARLRDYAKTFHAGPEWQHYTGTLAASQAAQRAFDVYRGNKMDHSPAMLIRRAPGAEWVRIDGFATADQLLVELADLGVPADPHAAPVR
jgi:protein SCO1/2